MVAPWALAPGAIAQSRGLRLLWTLLVLTLMVNWVAAWRPRGEQAINPWLAGLADYRDLPPVILAIPTGGLEPGPRSGSSISGAICLRSATSPPAGWCHWIPATGSACRTPRPWPPGWWTRRDGGSPLVPNSGSPRAMRLAGRPWIPSSGSPPWLSRAVPSAKWSWTVETGCLWGLSFAGQLRLHGSGSAVPGES